ncbi:transposase [Candidatus Woesearchaeota archaeon]|nr:transposase [Candidatus Woesearchaeota archaeon]
MIEEDIEIDELEEELFGDKEEGLTGMDKKDLKRIVREFNKSKDKKRVKKNIQKAKKEIKDTAQKKISLTDSESRMMKTAKSFVEPSYNAQLSVSRNQIIVANDICQDGHDAHQFMPQINNIEDNIKLKKKTKVGVDCAYSDGENIRFAEDNNFDLYVPSRAQAQEFDGKEQSLNHDKYEYDWKKDELIVGKHRFYFKYAYTRKNGKKILMYYNDKLKKKKDVPFYFRERLRMKEKMDTKEGRLTYGLRKITVEPVIGNIKQNLGFREFLLRGLDNVKIEFNLACIAHNLQKIWRLRAAKGC